jgi:hypothetical protein
MKKIISGIFILSFLMTAGQLFSQCENWTSLDAGNKDEAENLHVTYRDYIKAKNYDEAFSSWLQVFDLAPAADGNRDWHFKDGIAIYKHKFEKESDATKKKEYKDKILELYDQCIKCYEAKAIKVPKCADENCIKEKMGHLYGEKAFDMYYTLNSPYSQTLAALDRSTRFAGDNTLYTTFAPYANIVVYEFQKEGMSKEQARGIYAKLNEIAEHNIESNKKYGEYYKQAQDAMNAKFRDIEDEIFDCDYFQKKLEPEYRENEDNPEIVKYVYNKLLQQGCDKENPLLVELQGKWEKYAEEENAKRQAEFEANNPAFVAKKLYDDGDFEGAIAKYEETIDNESDPVKQADYYFRIASIKFRKLDQYSAARQAAQTAAKLRPGWGRPFILIGEMYARSSSSCGKDSFERGLAVIAALNKWSQAKSVDPSVAEDANDLIGRYSKYKPQKEDVFMRKASGKTFTVPCWIGESVKVTL